MEEVDRRNYEIYTKRNCYCKLNFNKIKKTFRKNVLGFMGDRTKYFKGDIEFYSMICFLDQLSNDSSIIKLVAKTGDLLEEMYSEIEPIFKEYVLDNEENKIIFEQIVEDLLDYFYNEIENNRHGSIMIKKTLQELGSLTPQDIQTISQSLLKQITSFDFTQISKALNNKKEEPIEEEKVLTEENVKEDIDNLKMKQLMSQYIKIKDESAE